MTDPYEEYEKESERIRAENDVLLDEFADWLSDSGLKDATVNRHCNNMHFYLNHYLLYYEAIDAANGLMEVEGFLGEWFIRKAMWSSQASIRSNSVSIKKFYAFMSEKGKVDKYAFEGLKEEIKDSLPRWLKTMALYEDPEVSILDLFGGP